MVFGIVVQDLVVDLGWMVLNGPKKHAKGYIEGLEMLASMRLCANVPAQHAIQTALGGYQPALAETGDTIGLRQSVKGDGQHIRRQRGDRMVFGIVVQGLYRRAGNAGLDAPVRQRPGATRNPNRAGRLSEH
jgi:hypothetical protein